MSTPARLLIRRNRLKQTTSSAPPITTSASFSAAATNKVFLHDWWLIKVDSAAHEKSLGVGGFTSKGSRGIKVKFVSAPISKRRNAVTLETVDGMIITVSGYLNRSRTLAYGLSNEVCDHFVFGFPFYWEEFAGQSFDRKQNNSDSDGQKASLSSGLSSSLPQSLDDLPVTFIRDFFIPMSGDGGSYTFSKHIFDDIMQNSGNAIDHNAALNSKEECAVAVRPAVLASDGAPLNTEKGKPEKRKRKREGDLLDAELQSPISQKPKHMKGSIVDVVLSPGPLTRSRARSCMTEN